MESGSLLCGAGPTSSAARGLPRSVIDLRASLPRGVGNGDRKLHICYQFADDAQLGTHTTASYMTTP